jgi:hypothetical protein
MATLGTPPKLQFFDNNGVPLAGGLLYTYAAGTTTPQATYQDVNGTINNTNPIVLDARGEALVWLGSGAYKMTLTTATGTQIWSVDNIGSSSTLPSLANRVLGDFTNINLLNRTMFQTTVSNGLSAVGVVPNGTNLNASWVSYNNSVPTNSSYHSMEINATDARTVSGAAGTSAFLPYTIYVNGAEVSRYLTNGRVGIGTTTPSARFGVVTTTASETGLSVSSVGGGLTIDNNATGNNYVDGATTALRSKAGVTAFTFNVATGGIGIGATPSYGTVGQVLTSTGTATTWQTPAAIPVGTITRAASSTAPTGYLKCDGSTYLQSVYPALATYIGQQVSPVQTLLGAPTGAGIQYIYTTNEANGYVFASTNLGYTSGTYTGTGAGWAQISTDGVNFSSLTSGPFMTTVGGYNNPLGGANGNSVGYGNGYYMFGLYIPTVSGTVCYYNYSNNLTTWTPASITGLAGGYNYLISDVTYGGPANRWYTIATGADVNGSYYTYFYLSASSTPTSWSAVYSGSNIGGYQNAAVAVACSPTEVLFVYGNAVTAPSNAFGVVYSTNGTSFTNGSSGSDTVYSKIYSSIIGFGADTSVVGVTYVGGNFYVVNKSGRIARGATLTGTWTALNTTSASNAFNQNVGKVLGIDSNGWVTTKNGYITKDFINWFRSTYDGTNSATFYSGRQSSGLYYGYVSSSAMYTSNVYNYNPATEFVVPSLGNKLPNGYISSTSAYSALAFNGNPDSPYSVNSTPTPYYIKT